MSTLVTGFLVGCAFGSILYLGGATSYRRILGTLLLKDMWIIKLMATAIGVGTLGISLLDFNGLAHLSIKPAYIVGVALGAAIFGIGWAVSGFCPGTCIVGAAEGKKDALAVMVGGFVGAFLFSLAYPSLTGLLEMANFGKITVEDLFGIQGLYFAVPMSAALLAVAFFGLKDKPRLTTVHSPVQP